MKHSSKPNLLLLTSSFPCSPSDETCGYIRDFARSLSVEFNVTVLAPPDRSAAQWPDDAFRLTRSRSLLPRSLDPLAARADLNHLVSAGPLAKLATLLSLVCFFAQALALAFRAEAVCSHWMVPSGLAGAFIQRWLRKPHVVVEHSGALHLLTRIRGGRRLARFIVQSSDQLVTVSFDLERKLIGLCPEARTKVDTIPMGVTFPSNLGEAITSTRSPSTILFVGRLTKIKGLDVLLKAMNGMDGISLIVAGEGELRGDLESLAKSLSVKARFAGRIGALEREQLLSTCTAVVIPSRVLAGGRTEGTPVVCLEAMAAGCVVIASRAGGLAEAIADGENGLLFERDDDRMLNEKLSLVLSNDILRRKIAENARRSAAAYDWALIGSRYNRIMKRALRKNDAIGNSRVDVPIVDG